MGKRKSRRKVITVKASNKLPTSFFCPYCEHEGVVGVKMDRKNKIGTVRCRICDISYSAEITPLDQEVDLYTEWVDKAEEANNPNIDEREPEEAGDNA